MLSDFKLCTCLFQYLDVQVYNMNKLKAPQKTPFSASTSRHPTSCMSAAEIMSVLFFHTMRYKVTEPRDPANDRFILSKVSKAECSVFSLPSLVYFTSKVNCHKKGMTLSYIRMR